MQEFIYKPYLKNLNFRISAVFAAGGLVSVLIDWRSQSLSSCWLYFLLALLPFVNALTFRGYILIDKDGLHAMSPHKVQLASVPWNSIQMCRLHPGGEIPFVCILLRNSEAVICGQKIANMNRPMQISLEGRKKLCDLALRKLLFKRMTKAQFANRDVFAFSITKEEYSQILAWWTNFNTT